MASTFGYTNASWTLKCDLTCDMSPPDQLHDRRGYRQCVPRNIDPSITELPS